MMAFVEVERFNPRYNRWDMMADMYCRRSNMATVIMDNSIFVIGGFSGKYSSLEDSVRL